MNSKICNKCHEEKPFSEYTRNGKRSNGEIRYRSFCKSCISKISKKYRNNNVKHQRDYAKKYYLSTKESRKKARLIFAKKWYQKNKKRCCDNARNWRKNHPEKVKAIEKRHSVKRLSFVKNRVSLAMANSIRRMIGKQKLGKHWEGIVGFNYIDLKNHLEKQFKNWMSWDNYGKWHIDHIIPVSFFKYSDFSDVDFRACWRLENLQPLWAKENLQKHNKILKKAI